MNRSKQHMTTLAGAADEVGKISAKVHASRQMTEGAPRSIAIQILLFNLHLHHSVRSRYVPEDPRF